MDHNQANKSLKAKPYEWMPSKDWIGLLHKDHLNEPSKIIAVKKLESKLWMTIVLWLHLSSGITFECKAESEKIGLDHKILLSKVQCKTANLVWKQSS